ncbi:hypothetical protein [Nostoc sp. KVJ20]|uniref:hypothetical protein n=1 Tax=Nostoc sp. KVJ20 TaxID=457944 RepID=UPI000A06EE73|nr:hypothetical protein [Nostoc sp. KVJ20]
MHVISQYSSDKPKTLVETAIHRVFKDKLSTPVTLTEPYCVISRRILREFCEAHTDAREALYDW